MPIAAEYHSLFGLDPRVDVAIIAAGVALATTILAPFVKHPFDRALERHRLKAEQEYEQRRKLRRLIASFHGRLLEASDMFHFRMLSLYADKEHDDWFSIPGDQYGDLRPGELNSYYFHSTLLRFLRLMSLATRFESSAFFIQSDLGSKRDVKFLFFAKGMRWMATDTELFADLAPRYEVANADAHFFTDHLRDMCSVIVNKDETERGLEKFADLLGQQQARSRLDPVLSFFAGLDRTGARRTWDRLVALDLVVMAFLNEFGYEEQKSSDELFRRVANQLRDPTIATNLLVLMHALHLQRYTRNIEAAARQVDDNPPEPFNFREFPRPPSRRTRIRQRLGIRRLDLQR